MTAAPDFADLELNDINDLIASHACEPQKGYDR
jgi:hypothetical protein